MNQEQKQAAFDHELNSFRKLRARIQADNNLPADFAAMMIEALDETEVLLAMAAAEYGLKYEPLPDGPVKFVRVTIPKSLDAEEREIFIRKTIEEALGKSITPRRAPPRPCPPLPTCTEERP